MTAISPIQSMQRAKGEALVSFGFSQGCVVLRGLRQVGSAKAMLPVGGAMPEVVFLNTSGGLTAGDRLRFGLTLDGGRVVATTQTAERAYRAEGGSSRMEVQLSVGPGGWLDWLPQETILFDGSKLDRRTVIDLAHGAGCLALEAVVLGRAAMGETVTRLAFRDRREIWRGGVPLSVEPLRAVLDEPGVEAAASAFDGKLVVRMLAADGWPLRRQIVRALSVMRAGRPLPRVWQI
jgi:urease accessory protein